MVENTTHAESTDFQPSKLGKKAHWDQVYEQEIVNFNDHGDIGEVWFGEDSVDKMVYWCEKNIENKQNSIIDLGCGNGHLCLELCSLGFTNLIGVDYSQSAVSLALQIAKDKGGDCTTNIHYQTMDILDSHQCTSLLLKNHGGIDFALDKGTYDAISLATAKDYKVESDITPTTACSPADIYVQMVHSLLSPTQGTLLITSCNWTEEELKSRFSKYFSYAGRIKYPTFKFGGVSGQTISTIALKALKIQL